MAGALAVCAFSARRIQRNRIVDAEQFLLRDSSGKICAELGMHGTQGNEFASVLFYDPDGVPRGDYAAGLLSFTNGLVLQPRYKDPPDPSKGPEHPYIPAPSVALTQSGLRDVFHKGRFKSPALGISRLGGRFNLDSPIRSKSRRGRDAIECEWSVART